MATWIPNQPVFFGELNSSCTCDDDIPAQIVDNTDDTQFQFNIEPCDDAENLIIDEDFNDTSAWTFGTNWAMAYNQVCLTDGVTTTTEFISDDVFEDGKYYKIIIVVDSIADGSIGVRFDDGGNAPVELGTITTTGTYTFYGFAESSFPFPINSYISIYNLDENVSACLSSLQAYQIETNFKFAIYDANTNSYQAEISYVDTPSYFSFVDDSLTVTVDWSALGLSNKCYYICLLDPCTNYNGQNTPISITNPNFTGNANGWTLGASWSYGTNSVDWTGFVIPENNRLSQEIFPSYSYFANVTIVVTAITGTVEVYFGTASVGTISSVGTHTFSGTPFGGFDLILEPSAIGGGTIDSITWNAPAFYEYHCDSQSNTFKLSDYTNNCTILINACNNEDGLGFNFSNSGFSPRIRLNAKLNQSKYSSERTIYEDSAGTKKNVFYKRRKGKNLCIDLQPEYIHDFLSLALGFDNFYLDGVAYVVDDDEYLVEYSDASDNLGKVKILVSEKTQNVVNVNCSDVENVCNLEENILLQADDLSQNILLTNGETITING